MSEKVKKHKKFRFHQIISTDYSKSLCRPRRRKMTTASSLMRSNRCYLIAIFQILQRKKYLKFSIPINLVPLIIVNFYCCYHRFDMIMQIKVYSHSFLTYSPTPFCLTHSLTLSLTLQGPEHIKCVFEIFDRDGSSAISRDEFSNILVHILEEEDIDMNIHCLDLFDRIDGDANGTITLEEFENFYVSIMNSSLNVASPEQVKKRRSPVKSGGSTGGKSSKKSKQ